MSTYTPWGYKTSETLPDILSVEEFNTMTAGKFAGDVRITSEIKAATASVRSYCGWHVATALNCEFEINAQHKALASVGSDLLIQLPARYVTAITRVILNAVKDGDAWTGTETTDFDFETNGILRIYDAEHMDRRAKIVIFYTAGLSNEEAASVKEVIAHNVTHALANSYGVQSESAGGVSISYSSAWAGASNATALSDNAKDILAPYKIQGVF